jgi:16S rRNA (cytidine1402-2'-O)-methyltransferase
MPGILYVVATPIGNLEDVTFRAVRILREVSLIAAEDTRRTSRLLQHYSIATPTTSLHEHNEEAKTGRLIQRLRDGESVALVSDAGTPVVSDPGVRLVAAAHAAGIRVEPIPGASAVMAAFSASGIGGGEFLFLGFPPAKASARRTWLERVAEEERPLVVYEAPHRIRDTLEAMLSAFGDRTVAIGRELTKAHEELVVGPISVYLARAEEPRGEFTVVVSGAPERNAPLPPPGAGDMAAEFGHLTASGELDRRGAIQALAEKYRMRSRTVYALIEQGRSSGD